MKTAGIQRGSREFEELAPYLKAVRDYPPLTRDEEHALALKARKGEVGAKQKLVRHNLAFVVAIARKQRRGTVRLDDLIQEGNVGLMRAVGEVRPARRHPFLDVRGVVDTAPTSAIPVVNIENVIGKKYLRNDLDLPEVAEIDLVRHYTNLSRRNFGVDLGFYPLGSCTMKYNPKVNENVAASTGFTGLHPYADAEFAQGNLQLDL